MNLKKEELLDIVTHSANTTYLTHKFHSFPGKFIPQIPNLLIRQFSSEGDTVFDPFCGSGTTLVEAKLSGRHSIGTDIHPLSVFMSKVKTTKIDRELLEYIPSMLKLVEKRLDNFYAKSGSSKTLLNFVDQSFLNEDFSYKIPEFPNRDHWFENHVLHELAIIKASIGMSDYNSDFRDFLLLAFSSIIVAVSNQDSETRYAAVKKEIPRKHPFLLFKNKLLDMRERMREFCLKASDCRAQAIVGDCRKTCVMPDDSIDLIVTSPPYPNTYDYYLYHKMRMFWLDMDWESAKFNEIGSRLKHSSQREGIESYINDMTECFKHFHKALNSEKPFVIVIGDSIIRKEFLKADEIVEDLAEKTGFKVLDEVCYDLGYASKAFNPAFRNKAKQEHIILLQNVK